MDFTETSELTNASQPLTSKMRDKHDRLRREIEGQGITIDLSQWEGDGYHGTSKIHAKHIVGKGFDIGLTNPKSWYGAGLYFFVDNDALGSGLKAAECFARHFKGGVPEPAVVKSRLTFHRLMDLVRSKTFWEIKAFVREKAPLESRDTVTDISIANFLGMHIADAFGCDGIKAEFPIQEPRGSNLTNRKHPGVCAKSTAVIQSSQPCEA